MESRKQLKQRFPSPFGWMMIVLCVLLALGLAILIYGLLTPQPTHLIDL